MLFQFQQTQNYKALYKISKIPCTIFVSLDYLLVHWYSFAQKLNLKEKGYEFLPYFWVVRKICHFSPSLVRQMIMRCGRGLARDRPGSDSPAVLKKLPRQEPATFGLFSSVLFSKVQSRRFICFQFSVFTV